MCDEGLGHARGDVEAGSVGVIPESGCVHRGGVEGGKVAQVII